VVTASGWADTSCETSAAGTLNHAKDVILRKLNVEHRTPNIERRILMTLRFIVFKTTESR
jgi:hypothetical protein